MAADIWYAYGNFFRTTLYVLLWTLILKYILNKYRRDPRFVKFAATLPGPPEFPIIGNGFEFVLHGIDNFDTIFSNFTIKYGSVYRMWIGKHLVVALSDLEHVETVFRSTKTLGKPYLFHAFHDIWKNSVFTAPMQIWRRTRKRMQPIFAKSVVKFQIPLINKSVEKYVNLMRKEIDGPEFDLNNYMPYLAVDSFIRIHFDLNLTSEQHEYFKFHETLKLVGIYGVTSILIPWLRINVIRRLQFKNSLPPALARLRKFINRIKDIELPEADKNWDVKEVRIETLAKSLLSTGRRLQEELQIDDFLFQEFGLMICAAADTTSNTAAFFLLAVAMYPEIQDKLYNELCTIFDANDDRPANMDDLSRLPYLDQVIKETQRRFTLVPVIFREVEEDIKIGSMEVPAGTTIMVRIGDIHLNPDLYPNPLEFNPENFSSEAISRRSKYAWIPFSAGTRDCIGKTYAETAMKLMLIGLLRNFKFSTTTKMEEIRYSLSFTVGKREGYWVNITSRK